MVRYRPLITAFMNYLLFSCRVYIFLCLFSYFYLKTFDIDHLSHYIEINLTPLKVLTFTLITIHYFR